MSVAAGERIPLLLFKVGGVTLAIPVRSVRRVLSYRPPIAVPLPRPGTLGLLLETEGMIPVMDLAGLLRRNETDPTMLIVCDGEDFPIAFPVHEVVSMPSLTLSDFVHPGFVDVSVPARYVRAVGIEDDTRVIVLNTVSLMDHLAAGSTS